jgi:hypothetical protein
MDGDITVATTADRFRLDIPQISLPRLRTLHLEGCLTPVSSLFRALPDPQIDLAIRINQTSDGDHSSDWRPNIGGRYTEIHERIVCFWCSQGEDVSGGALDVDNDWQDPDVAKITMSFGSGPRVRYDPGIRLFYKCPVRVIDEFDPLLEHIRTLRFSHPQSALTLGENHASSFYCLPNIQHIAVEECCVADLTDLEHWFRRRMSSNH